MDPSTVDGMATTFVRVHEEEEPGDGNETEASSTETGHTGAHRAITAIATVSGTGHT